MEVVIAAIIAAVGAGVIAGLRRKDKRDQAQRTADGVRQAKQDEVLAELAARTKTNGSNKTIGELVELMYVDLQQTKRDLSEHQRRNDAHGLQPPWERRDEK